MKDSLILCVLMACCFLSACTEKGPNPIDPYEDYNRKVWEVQQAIDKVALRPVAVTYNKVAPWPVKTGINNIFNNLYEVPTLGNAILQGKGKTAVVTFWRFLINSTIGVFGTFDVAKHMGLKRHYEDFGLTLARWGDKDSPYMVSPLFGPGTIRDNYGFFIDFMTWTPYFHIPTPAIRWGVTYAYFVVLRTNLLDGEKVFADMAIDPYAFQRDAYLQRRKYLMSDGELGEDADPLPADFEDEGSEEIIVEARIPLKRKYVKVIHHRTHVPYRAKA